MANPIYLSEPMKGSDLKLVVSSYRAAEIQRAIEKRPRLLGKIKSYEFKGASTYNMSRGNFTPPIYDLSEVARAADVEPYINQSIRKHREQILKEGYQISGLDEVMVDYVRRRLFEMSIVTGITTEQWLREVVTNLITYHNSFLIFRRDATRSSGKPITLYGKEIDPIAGVYVGDPTAMEVIVDKYGTPKKWRQYAEAGYDSETDIDRTFNAEDVVIITVDKKTGFTFGTPFILPVMDDIRALRKLEEVAIIMASKEAFPLYHYKVGTPEKPAIQYEGGGDEVAEVLSEVQSLPSQGFVVTSERHEIDLVSKAGGSLDLGPYLEYFEARVIAGLRLSPLDLGRGGALSRGTATNLNQGLQDSAKDYQQVISDHITNFLIIPLLLEGGFDIDESNIVRFTFPTINREEERASQNHGLQLMMGNAISNNEFRKQYLNKQPMTPEEQANTQHTQQLEAQKELIRLQGQYKSSGPSSSSNSASIGAVRAQITNRGQPANQFGSKPAKSRFKQNDYSDIVKNLYNDLKNNILAALEIDEIDTMLVEDYFREFVKQASEASKTLIDESILNGYLKAKKDYSHLFPDEDLDLEEIGQRAKDRFHNNFVIKSYWKIITPFKDQIFTSLSGDQDHNIDVNTIIQNLASLEDRIKILTTDQVITSERFGFIKFAKKVGRKTIDLVNPVTEDRTELDISELIYKNFVPNETTVDHYLSFHKNV